MDILQLAVIGAALGSGVVGGVLFAFSTFVMQALKRLPPVQGIRAMQLINITVMNPWAMGLFVGTAILSLIVAGMSVWNWQQPGAPWLLAGSLTYVVGTFLITGTRNVPLNDQLENVEPASVAGHEFWQHYLSRWTGWNHVRTLAAVVAPCLLVLPLLS